MSNLERLLPWATLTAIAVIVWRAKSKFDDVGKSIGDWFYTLTHRDFVSTYMFTGVRLMDAKGTYLGVVIDIPKSLLNDQRVFPYQGVLYVLGQDVKGQRIGARAPAGTRYRTDTGEAVQNAAGRTTFVPL